MDANRKDGHRADALIRRLESGQGIENEVRPAQTVPPSGVWERIKAETIDAQTPGAGAGGFSIRTIFHMALGHPKTAVGISGFASATLVGIIIFIASSGTSLLDPKGRFLSWPGGAPQSFTGNGFTLKTQSATHLGLTETDKTVHAFIKKGAATFNVDKSRNAPKPLVVWFPGGFLQTLGTEFKVETGKGNTRIILRSGKIWVATRQKESPGTGPVYRLQTLSGSGDITIRFDQDNGAKANGINAVPWPAIVQGNGGPGDGGAGNTSGGPGNAGNTNQEGGWKDLPFYSQRLSELEKRLPDRWAAAPQIQEKQQSAGAQSPDKNAAKQESKPIKTIVVFLKNGNKITGQLTGQTKTKIRLKTPMGVLNIPRTEITKWEEKP